MLTLGGAVRWSLAVAVAMALAPAAASADHPGAGPQTFTLDDGTAVTTHGPDSAEQLGGVSSSERTGPVPAFAGLERAPLCATTNHVRLFYAYPANQPNNVAAHAADMRRVMREADWALNRDGVASGGVETDYRVRCVGGQMTIDSFPVPAGQTSFNEVLNALQAAGLQTEDTKHLMFFDTNVGGCGVGSWQADDRTFEPNPERHPANAKGWSVLWKNCWNGFAAMHELGHNMGAVAINAPNSTGIGGHCTDEEDVMCQPDPAYGFPDTFDTCTDRPSLDYYFDCGFNDYFNTNPLAGNYLATHWNLGHPRNFFLAFDASPPTADFSVSCAKKICTFTGQSTDSDGSIASRSWDFGDGTTGTGAVAVHTYAKAGTYHAGLTAADDHGLTDFASKAAQPVADPAGFNSCRAAAAKARTRAVRRAKRARRRALRRARGLPAPANSRSRRRAARRKRAALKRANKRYHAAVADCRKRFL